MPGWGLGLGEDVTSRPGSYREFLIKYTQTKARSSLLGDVSGAALLPL